MSHSILEWIVFWTIIGLLLILDLGYLNKKNKVLSFEKSIYLSLFYFCIACIFGVYIYLYLGGEKSKQYFTGFLIEKAMALDNIFIISIIFKFFAIPPIYQHRVLIYGIGGVLILRAIMISVGSALVIKFSWILYFFAFILILTGVKIFYIADKHFDVKELAVYKFLQKHIRITKEIKSDRFFVKVDRKIYATPLFVALIIIEAMDLVFAIDSIPAIFAVTLDPYIVYTSNIFAILGLRALFFCLADVVEKFKYVKYSLALVLIVIGIKIMLHHYVEIPTFISLSFTIVILGGGIIFSIIKNRQKKLS